MIKIISNSRHKKLSEVEGINQAINKQLTCSCCKSVFSFDDYNDVQTYYYDTLSKGNRKEMPIFIRRECYYVACPVCGNAYKLAEEYDF